MTRLDTRLGHFKHRRNIMGRELFEVPHHKDLAVVGRQAIQGPTHPLSQFFSEQIPAGAGSTDHEPIDQLHRRLIGQEKILTPLVHNTALLRLDVAVMEMD